MSRKCARFMILAVVGLMVCLVTGCDKDADSKLDSIIANREDCITYIEDNTCVMLYKTCHGQETALLNSVFKKISILSCEVTEEGAYSVTFCVPDITTLAERRFSDGGYMQDLKKLRDTKATGDEIDQYTLKYLTALTAVSTEYTREYSGIAYVSGDKITEWEGYATAMKDVCACIQMLEKEISSENSESVEADNGSSVETTDTDVGADILKLPKVPVGGDFAFSQDGARYLVTDVKILTGDAAKDKLTAISEVNDVLNTSEMHLISFSVQALTRGKHTVSSKFVLADDYGVIYSQNNTSVVAGLNDSAVIHGGEKVKMTTCIFGPDDARIVWFSEKGKDRGTYEIIE